MVNPEYVHRLKLLINSGSWAEKMHKYLVGSAIDGVKAHQLMIAVISDSFRVLCINHSKAMRESVESFIVVPQWKEELLDIVQQKIESYSTVKNEKFAASIVTFIVNYLSSKNNRCLKIDDITVQAESDGLTIHFIKRS